MCSSLVPEWVDGFYLYLVIGREYEHLAIKNKSPSDGSQKTK
jgi:hypothetical protein